MQDDDFGCLQLNHQGRDAITNVLDRLIAIRDGEL